MTKLTTTMKLGLCALALGAGLAAQAAAPVITNITMVGATPQFGVHSDLGITNQIECSTNLSQPNWVVLTNLVVTESPYWFVDEGAPPVSQRFYRVESLGGGTPPPGMVLIPAGSFTMGNCMNSSEGGSNELPLHMVYVSAFYMDQYEVTKALWDEVKAWNGGNGYVYENAGAGKATNHPVQTVNWRDCVKWCNARSQKDGLTSCYYNEEGLTTVYKTGTNTPYAKWDADGYRLPTEAEWEKAARGGASGQRFPWGNTISWSQANYYSYWSGDVPYYPYDVNPTSGNNPAWTSGGSPYTTAVGTFAANGYGLYDMAGNVWEWCWDWYSNTSYSASPGTDPRGPASGSIRVLRGGSWSLNPYYCRSAYRSNGRPERSDSNIGFRSVLPAGQ